MIQGTKIYSVWHDTENNVFIGEGYAFENKDSFRLFPQYQKRKEFNYQKVIEKSDKQVFKDKSEAIEAYIQWQKTFIGIAKRNIKYYEQRIENATREVSK